MRPPTRQTHPLNPPDLLTSNEYLFKACHDMAELGKLLLERIPPTQKLGNRRAVPLDGGGREDSRPGPVAAAREGGT